MLGHSINLCGKLVLGMFICPLPTYGRDRPADNLSSVLFSHTTQPFAKEIIYAYDIITDPQRAILEREAG